jgi:hypothetical protein
MHIRLMDDCLLTLDIDWAADWMVDRIADTLVAAGVKATWFVTHHSAATSALATEANFELGIHPNFLSTSTHGANEDAVMRHCLTLVPNARAVRTHSLFQSEPLLARMSEQYGLKIDCSIYLPGATGVSPHCVTYSDLGPPLIRVPHIFQDNMHMLSGANFVLDPNFMSTPGLKVFNFHPVHVALNTSSIGAYSLLKINHDIRTVRPEELPAPDERRPGAGSMLRELVEFLSDGRSWTVSEYVGKWLSEGNHG